MVYWGGGGRYLCKRAAEEFIKLVFKGCDAETVLKLGDRVAYFGEERSLLDF